VRTFVDTSALYALLDADDANHVAAAAWFGGLGDIPSEILVTHSYVVVETAALVHHRLGAAGVRDLFDALLPAMSTTFVEGDLHRRAVAAYLAGLNRRVSFVDRVSFELVRDAGLDRAFAFDRDFSREGIPVVP
jgi:predicted nucleic acid-binding protein